MDLTISVKPTTFSIDKTLVKAGKRIKHANEDTVIDFWIAAADAYVEKRTNLALMKQTLKLRLRRILHVVYLPRTAAASITSVKSTATGGTETTIASSSYVQTVDRMLTRIDLTDIPACGQDGMMEIVYDAGAADPTEVPAPLRQASYLLAAHWLTSREAAFMDVRTMNVEKRIAYGVEELVREYRVPNGTALNDGW